MRRLAVTIAVLLFGVTSLASAEQDPGVPYDPSWTVHDLARAESIPVKNLATELDLVLADAGDRSLAELGITARDAAGAIDRYRDGEPRMVGGIVAVGMIIVFASLVIVAFLISLFQHLHALDRVRSPRKFRSVKSVVGTITSQGDLGEQSIAAVVAAIFLHEEEVDAENRLLLTWKRAAGSAWRTNASMPNASYFAAKRGRS